MKTTRLLILVVILAALVLVSCGAGETAPLTVPEGAQAGDLTSLEKCEYQAGDKKVSAECGAFVVPENWDKADSQLIALPPERRLEARPGRHHKYRRG